MNIATRTLSKKSFRIRNWFKWSGAFPTVNPGYTVQYSYTDKHISMDKGSLALKKCCSTVKHRDHSYTRVHSFCPG
jgi:hypothetical protein